MIFSSTGVVEGMEISISVSKMRILYFSSVSSGRLISVLSSITSSITEGRLPKSNFITARGE